MDPNNPAALACVPPPPPPSESFGTVSSHPPRPPYRARQRSRHLSQRIRSSTHALLRRQSAWLQRWSPAFLLPCYCWSRQPLSIDLSPHEMPHISMPHSPSWSKWAGYIHCCLQWLSEYYCAWYGHEYSSTIVPLPYGLILKWSDGTSFDEAHAMMTVRTAGIPCPKVISVGEHPSSPSAPVSILMTRLPGEPFDEAYDDLMPDQREVVVEELKAMLNSMRQWKSPRGRRSCSISGGPIRSIRVSGHRIGPCETEVELLDFLLAPVSKSSFDSAENYHQAVQTAKTLGGIEHKIVFTHGDLALHNVLVHDGHVSGFIDWESAGWYPEYWEFTTPSRWPGRDLEDGAMFRRLGGERYEMELKAELALRDLTVDSWISV